MPDEEPRRQWRIRGMHAGGRAVVAGTLTLVITGVATAGMVIVRHGPAQRPSSVAVTALASPTASETPVPTDAEGTLDPTPVPTPIETPTPVPTARPTVGPTTDTTLPRCDASYLQAFTTVTRRPNGTVLIDLAFHHEWGGACSFPRTCKLGWTATNAMGGPFKATDEPVTCTAPWTRWTGDFHVSALWSTCHDAGDYDVTTRYVGLQGWAQYTAASIEPPGCSLSS
jgi:hypothetical protein